jgi:hypothetical protein
MDHRPDLSTTLRRLDRSAMTSIVRSALHDDGLEVERWDVRKLSYDYTSPISAGVHQVVGTARHGKRRLSWSLVHKAVRPAAGVVMPGGEVVPPDLPEGPAFFGYWKREPLTYAAGLLEGLPGGLTAPRCFGVWERPDGTIWLWLEQVAEEEESAWTLERCAVAGRILGRFNGTYLAGQVLPSEPYLVRGWLRSWLTVRVTGLLKVIGRENAWRHPLVHRTIPASVREYVVRLWADRETLLDGLDRLPHALCHRDAFRSNLFLQRGADGSDRLTAIDWAFTGIGPIGEELAPLVAAAPAGDGPELAPWLLDTPVFRSYLQGVLEAGWQGDARLVRFGYAASAALRYLFLSVAEMLGDARDEGAYTAIEQRRGRTIEQVMEQQAMLIELLIGLADEARALLPWVNPHAQEPRPPEPQPLHPAGILAGSQ